MKTFMSPLIWPANLSGQNLNVMNKITADTTINWGKWASVSKDLWGKRVGVEGEKFSRK